MASVKPISRSTPVSERASITPAEVYGPEGAEIKLRIATGGAGQTGLLRKLAEEFIAWYARAKADSPFRIAWIATDTSLSFNALASGAADMSITYHAYAEKLALRQGIADRCVYAWRDHFMLVGPDSNPANLPRDQKLSIYELFARLFESAVETATSANPVRFLSRYDKSANNIRESHIWTTIGQTPWAHPYSSFYHRYVDFPFGALRAASRLGEYTLVDRGTWYAIEEGVRQGMTVFVSSTAMRRDLAVLTEDLKKESVDAAEDDPLINPAHALVGAMAQNRLQADAFVEWLQSDEGGQRVVGNFAVHGTVLHSRAVSGVDPLSQVRLYAKL